MVSSFDILIVGAGVVGLTTALALSKKTNLTIGLIDSKKISPTWNPDSTDLRVSAISPASKKIVESLGVWTLIQAKRTSPYTKMSVWNQYQHSEINFKCDEVNADALGHIVEDSAVRDSLLEALANRYNVTLFSSVQLISLQKNQQGVELASTDAVFTATLLIAADGGDSWVRHQLDIMMHKQAYDHHALVASVETELSHQQTASQRFLPNGPLAFLPLASSNQCSIVWSAPAEDVRALLALSDTEFKQSLENAFEHKLGSILTVSQRASFPLIMRHASSYVQEHIALVGDAAHTIHPLAGQGVNMGLLDVASLVDVISSAHSLGRKWYSLATLRAYERERKSHNTLLLTVVDSIKKLFERSEKPIQHWREVGMQLTQHSQLLKQFFMRHAMGDASQHPRLQHFLSGDS
jgi:2-octaprenylphenol hydroxylase